MPEPKSRPPGVLHVQAQQLKASQSQTSQCDSLPRKSSHASRGGWGGARRSPQSRPRGRVSRTHPVVARVRALLTQFVTRWDQRAGRGAGPTDTDGRAKRIASSIRPPPARAARDPAARAATHCSLRVRAHPRAPARRTTRRGRARQSAERRAQTHAIQSDQRIASQVEAAASRITRDDDWSAAGRDHARGARAAGGTADVAATVNNNNNNNIFFKKKGKKKERRRSGTEG